GGHIIGHACLTGDSLIQLGDGSIKEIKNMNQEEVFSSDFSDLKLKVAKSDKVFSNPDVNKIYSIQTTNVIHCSELHRFFSVENFSLVEKESKELCKGSFIAHAGKIEIFGEEQKLPIVNIKRIGKISKEERKLISDELEKGDITRKEICGKVGITPRHFRRILNQSYPTDARVFDELRDYFSGKMQLQMVPVYTYKHKNLIMPEVMGPQLSQICGYFIGDGNFEKRGLRFKDERQEVLNSYNILFEEVFGVKGSITKVKDKNCFILNINSKEIKDLFSLILPDILNAIAKSRENIVRSFIRGFIDAEGSIDNKRPRITVAQKEKQVLRYLQLFLLRFGIRSFLRFDVGRKRISNLSIRDRDVKDYLEIGFSASDKQERLLKWVEHYECVCDKEMMPVKRNDVSELLKSVGLKPFSIIKSRGSDYKWISRRELEKAHLALMNTEIKDRQIKQKVEFICVLLNSDLRFEKIQKIKISDNKCGLLFDFSVPKTENYLANGFVVHNSTYRIYLRRGKQGSRVAKLIDSPNLPDNETLFYVTEAGVVDEA
ncbi:MAG: hypothetical protein KKB79_01110, partial [Nanoarchaeota archaeon]|nr:hypothetical protein [Nanoarchaeota archaeon]